MGRTNRSDVFSTTFSHFNSLAPCGANPLRQMYILPAQNFNSLAPCGANLPFARGRKAKFPFQLTRPVRGEPIKKIVDKRDPYISTHSPRAGRTAFAGLIIQIPEISTHSPRAGRTKAQRMSWTSNVNFNSLAPCGANPCTSRARLRLSTISTHSPRAGRTSDGTAVRYVILNFNSLAPCGANRQLASFADCFRNFNSLAPCGANRCKSWFDYR